MSPPRSRRDTPPPRTFEEPVDPKVALENLEALRVVQDRLVEGRLGELAEAVRGNDAAERALAGIVLDTLGEKEELDDVVLTWKASTEGYAASPRHREGAPLPDLLESLLNVKRSAARRYWAAAAACPDEQLAERLRRLASQNSEHAAILLTMRADVED